MNTVKKIKNQENAKQSNATGTQILSLIEYKQIRAVEDKLFLEINNHTTFDIEYIKKIHALIFNIVDDKLSTFRTVKSTDYETEHPMAYLVENEMSLYKRIILNKQDMDFSTPHELIKYLTKVFCEFIFISPFTNGNIQVACVLINSILYKKKIKVIDFAKINQIPYHEYVIAKREAIRYNYSRMTDIIRAIMYD